MRIFPISSAERTSLLKTIAAGGRIDGRSFNDIRRIEAKFADSERGCLTLSVGNTCVVAKVTHEIVEPYGQRPAEGQLMVNLEIPGLDGWGAGRLDDDGLKVQRALERCFKESKCLDLESLCIVAGEKVFQIKITVHVLNDDGNVIDTAGLAVILALADYRRPDVALVEGQVRIGEKDPVPLNLNFFPIIQTFGLFDDDGKFILSDLTSLEECIVKCKVVVAMNMNKEVCCLLTIGAMLIDTAQLIKCTKIAGRKVKALTKLVSKALSDRGLDTAAYLPSFQQNDDAVVSTMNQSPEGGDDSDDGEVSDSDMDISETSSSAPQPQNRDFEFLVPLDPYKMAEVRDSGVSHVQDEVLSGLKLLRAQTEQAEAPAGWSDDEEEPTLAYL